jgi:hypothetical protein
VPVEGVVHALRKIHAALVPGGIVVDTQPLSPRPPVDTATNRLGTLDMREWRRTIDAVDGRMAQAIDEGLFAIEGEHIFEVADEFDSGAEFVEVVGAWRGTLIPAPLVKRAAAARPPVRVIQDVRLRLLRALPRG